MNALICILAALSVGAGQDVPAAAPTAEPTAVSETDPTLFAPSLKEVFDQLNLLDLFGLATRMGGMTIKVPEELRRLPARMIDKDEELKRRGIELSVKELHLRDLRFIYPERPAWDQGRPRVPVMVEFGRIGLEADAKTNLGVIPMGATFENGRLPVEFLPMPEKGYDLQLLPESRSAETDLSNVKLRVGGPLVTGIANRFFTDKVAALILEHGIGQTLRMGQGDLLGGKSVSELSGIAPDSTRGRVLDAIVDVLSR